MLSKLTIFLPLIGFFVSGVLSRIKPNKSDSQNFSLNFSDKFAQYITTALMFASAICATLVFIEFYQTRHIQSDVLFNFIKSGNFIANWSIHIDALSATMLIVVTYVSCLVHLYSIGYMHEDRSVARFMSYLSLFTFFMLALVTGDNFVQLFFGWEGVGVASYLLIGFWFKKESANCASMKAFIANRVGDLGLILAISLIYISFGSVEYSKVFYQICNHSGDRFFLFGKQFLTIDTICILLFIGAMGKSAQIGLHVWLADAMEGPTPVSALIHAATMVTAGVFLVARCSPLFELSPIALDFVVIIGATTALFSATIALTQNDIKKIIAYSTCSQLGYMFFACGLSAYSGAIFHLATHAFFKALLFLSAGSVIHAMHHEQDIQKMGGLWKKIPFTYAMMWIGSLALAGFPPFAGFYSKDVILESAYMAHTTIGKFAFYVGILTAFLTAFYSWRLLFLTFHGKTRADQKTFSHAHESPINMLIPLAVLAVGSIGTGYVGYHLLKMVSTNGFFTSAITVSLSKFFIYDEIHHAPTLVKISPMIVGILAIILSYIFYIKRPNIPHKLAKTFPKLYKLSYNKWYFDEFYENTLISPSRKLGNFLWKIIDVKIIDAVPNGIAYICRIASTGISKIQTGLVYNYATWMIFGLALIGITFIDFIIPMIAKDQTLFGIVKSSFLNLFSLKF
ncbi:MAG: NADH-quinone oxidoreductase subunit L [Proteobacteria bacterium]|nr:NADH-quinone oxidoreductase subunit L [Pseudomonadota bacterium]